ncbi:MAG: hypothetical protein M3436_15870 [Pseudomonadota bacterium]|nr:hypothetical protein [Pseudomonadota bacterium]
MPQIELGGVARYCCDPVPARKRFFSDTAADHAARPEQCDFHRDLLIRKCQPQNRELSMHPHQVLLR